MNLEDLAAGTCRLPREVVGFCWPAVETCWGVPNSGLPLQKSVWEGSRNFSSVSSGVYLIDGTLFGTSHRS